MALGLTALQLGASPATGATGDYLLLSRARLLSLPTDSAAWRYMVNVANSAWSSPDLDDQDNKANVQALAAALVYARTGDSAMRSKARSAIEKMIPTYNLSVDSGLGPARQIAGWVLTADFIGLDGSLDGQFRDLLRRALERPIGSHNRWGGSLRVCHEDSDNNWGAWCGASRMAAARYLGDSAEVEGAEQVRRGFLGDRGAWSKFRGQGSSNSLLTSEIRSWSCDASASAYVPTNPDCGDRSGAFPADAARSGAYSRLDAAYQSETTAGLVLATELAYQAGYSTAWTGRNALARVAAFDYRHGAWNLGSAQYHWPWLVNRRLGTSYPTVAARYGRSLGYTDWLYGGGSNQDPGGTPSPDPTPRPTATPTPRPDPTDGPVSSPDPTDGPTWSPTPHPGKGKGNNGPKKTSSPTMGPAASPLSVVVPISTLESPDPTPGEAPSAAAGEPEAGGQPEPQVAEPGKQPAKGAAAGTTADGDDRPTGDGGRDSDPDGPAGAGDVTTLVASLTKVVGESGMAPAALALLIAVTLALRFLLPRRGSSGS